jgi:hypothetical protein
MMRVVALIFMLILTLDEGDNCSDPAGDFDNYDNSTT